jgi:ferrous iron transport protein A
MKLSQINKNNLCTIQAVHAKGKLLQKLLDMGFVDGAKIEIVRVAPLYDPMQLKIHDYDISLRKSEAELIEVSI